MQVKPMKIRAWTENGLTTVKAIVFHPMETGQRKDKKTGQLIPAHFIQELTCTHAGRPVLTCLWSTAVSKNPFLSFRFKGAKSGDTLVISWKDNQGNSGQGEASIG